MCIKRSQIRYSNKHHTLIYTLLLYVALLEFAVFSNTDCECQSCLRSFQSKRNVQQYDVGAIAFQFKLWAS